MFLASTEWIGPVVASFIATVGAVIVAYMSRTTLRKRLGKPNGEGNVVQMLTTILILQRKQTEQLREAQSWLKWHSRENLEQFANLHQQLAMVRKEHETWTKLASQVEKSEKPQT